MTNQECKCKGDGLDFADWSRCPIHDATTSPAQIARREAVAALNAELDRLDDERPGVLAYSPGRRESK